MPDDVVLRQLARGEREPLHALLELAFHVPTVPEARARTNHVLELDRTLMAFDGDLLVGSSAAYTQRLSVPGGELPCAGITMVVVRPTHRRRGLLRRMMTAHIAEARRRGEPLAALWASEGGIYGRFGYGPASWEVRIEIPGGGAAPARADDTDVRVELRPPAGAGVLLAPLWDELRHRRGGVPDRTPAWWETRVLADLPDERDGALELRLALARDTRGAGSGAADGRPRGYALYRVRGGASPVLELKELVAPDPDAEGALWSYLCGIDLIERLRAPCRPVDDPIALRFDDVRRARAVDVREGLWLRLVDVPAALASRTWATTDDLTLSVRDALVPGNAGEWRLETAAGDAGRCGPTDRAPDLVLDVRELGAAYLGGTPLTRLADAGLVDERTPGAAERLDAALQVPRAPWTPEQF